jgi:hypothetical protein
MEYISGIAEIGRPLHTSCVRMAKDKYQEMNGNIALFGN